MKVTPTQNRNKTSFGSVNLVQISRTAFTNEEDLLEISKKFIDLNNKAFGEINGGLSSFLTKHGFGKKPNKTMTFLESPLFVSIEKFCQKNKLSNPYKLGEKSGIQQKGFDENYLSFYVLTKEDKDAAFDLLNEKSKTASKEIDIKGINPLDSTGKISFRAIMTRLELQEKKIVNDALISATGAPQKTFKVESLSELPAVFKQIDVK